MLLAPCLTRLCLLGKKRFFCSDLLKEAAADSGVPVLAVARAA